MAKMIPKKYWKIYTHEDTGDLMYVGRWNGGGYAFKYDKKNQTLDVIRRGIYSPMAYTPYNDITGRKHRYYCNVYKLYTKDNKSYYVYVNAADEYLPDELPDYCVDYDGSIDIDLTSKYALG